MTAVPEHIKVFRGDTKNYSITIFAENERLTLTDWTIRFTVKENKSDTDANAVIQILGTTVDADNGIGKIVLNKAHTDTLTPGDYYYDIQIDNLTTGQVSTIRNGIFTVKEDITRTSLA